MKRLQARRMPNGREDVGEGSFVSCVLWVFANVIEKLFFWGSGIACHVISY